MTHSDLFSSCCDAIDRLLDGMEADTTPEMSEQEMASAIVHAARRDHPFTEDFWQRYRKPGRGKPLWQEHVEYPDAPYDGG